MRPVPVKPELLPELLAETIASTPGRVRVAVDGAPAAHPLLLADALIDPLNVLGRPAHRVSAADFLRPASLRLEHGREDPAAYRDEWLDAGALHREVLEPFARDGSGRYLPSLWDPVRDRATRAEYLTAEPDAVLLLDGTLLLDRGLPLDLTIHVRLSAGALHRRTPQPDRWTLPAYADYPGAERADIVVLADDPARPAVTVRIAGAAR
jgi:hypothetical protein